MSAWDWGWERLVHSQTFPCHAWWTQASVGYLSVIGCRLTLDRGKRNYPGISLLLVLWGFSYKDSQYSGDLVNQLSVIPAWVYCIGQQKGSGQCIHSLWPLIKLLLEPSRSKQTLPWRHYPQTRKLLFELMMLSISTFGCLIIGLIKTYFSPQIGLTSGSLIN